VQVSALVDETDVGKVQPGVAVTISVDAFPHRTFDGIVLKIEPQAQVSQNVTMFPVEVNIPNPEHVLKPGMNTEVEIHIGQRQGVLAVPNAALRTPKDVASAASVLGLDSLAVARQLAAPADAPRASADTTRDGGKLHAAEVRRSGGRHTVSAPPPAATPGPGYIVFALRGGKIVPVSIATGLTDQDYIEVTGGLAEKDTVLVLTGAGAR